MIDSPDEFKTKLKAHMWNNLKDDLNNNAYTYSNSDSQLKIDCDSDAGSNPYVQIIRHLVYILLL